MVGMTPGNKLSGDIVIELKALRLKVGTIITTDLRTFIPVQPQPP
jgi:hypothetical protein